MSRDPNISVGEQVLSSTLWMGSWRWSARLIGFATTIILARLLLPEDFGIVATGAIISGFFGIMTRLGTDAYLIRHENPERADYDTAWSLRLIVICVASIGIYFAAQPGADYFNDQRLVDVLQILAVVGALNGFTNIGLTIYRRDLQFRKIAMIGITQRLTSTATTIALAIWLQNYWAMVIGEIVFTLVGLALSFIHPYRPRFTLVHLRYQWDFCKWITLQNIATFMAGQGDSFIIVKYFGIELMGVYSMAMRFAALPTQQVLAPALQPIYSGLAKKQHDLGEFNSSVIKLVSATAILMLPAATLVSSLSQELITAILGDRWLLAIPLVVALTLSIMLGVMTGPAGAVLTIKGRVRLLAGLNWFSAVSVVAVLFIVAQWQDVEILVWARVGISLCLLMFYYAFMLAATGISVFTLLDMAYRPVLASLAMALAVNLVSTMFSSDWAVILVGVTVGGATFLLVMALLWKLAGSPDAGETLLVNKFVKIIQRRVKRPH